MTNLTKTVGIFSVAAMSVAAYAFQSIRELYLDGNLISSRLVLQNGRYLVPVDDVAKALGYKFSVNGGTATLTKVNNASATATLTPDPDAPASTQAPQVFAGSGQTGANPASSTYPNLPASSMPTTAIPGTAVSTATSNLFPDQSQAPAQINSSVGAGSNVNGFTYKVVSIQDVGERYKDRYDQRGQTIHPAWKTDMLEVINIAVTNNGTSPASVYAPGIGDITVFDSKKIGLPALAIDIQQSPDALNSDTDYDLAGMGSNGSLMLGPTGTLNYAVIASVPKNDQIMSLLVNIPGGQNNSNAGMGSISTSSAPGAVLTITR